MQTAAVTGRKLCWRRKRRTLEQRGCLLHVPWCVRKRAPAARGKICIGQQYTQRGKRRRRKGAGLACAAAETTHKPVPVRAQNGSAVCTASAPADSSAAAATRPCVRSRVGVTSAVTPAGSTCICELLRARALKASPPVPRARHGAAKGVHACTQQPANRLPR